MHPCPAAFPLRLICFASDFRVGDTGGFVPFSLTFEASLLTYGKNLKTTIQSFLTISCLMLTLETVHCGNN
jgi:hypothetical protein